MADYFTVVDLRKTRVQAIGVFSIAAWAELRRFLWCFHLEENYGITGNKREEIDGWAFMNMELMFVANP
jgi:hypothetical protein